MKSLLFAGLMILPLASSCGPTHRFDGMETTKCKNYKYHIEAVPQRDDQGSFDDTRKMMEDLDAQGWEIVNMTQGGGGDILFLVRKKC